MSEPEPAKPSLFRLLASLGEAGSTGDTYAQTVLGRARLIGKILLGLFALNFLHSCSTLWRDGPVFATVPVTFRAGDKGMESATRLNLERAMNRVSLRISHTDNLAAKADFDLTVTGPDGRKIASQWLMLSSTSGPPQTGSDHWITSVLFDVERDGEHEVQIKERTFEPKSKPPILTLHFSRNTTQSHFISNSVLLAFGAWLASVWWRRTQALPWWNQHEDRAALAMAAPPPLVAGVSPLMSDLPPVAPPMRPRQVAPSTAEPQTASVFSVPFEAPAEQGRLHGVAARLVIEALMLGVSIVRVPIFGAYTMLVVIATFWVIGGLELESFGGGISSALESPLMDRVARWIIPEGHFEGAEALEALGLAALKVLLPFHLIAMVVRAFRPEVEPSPVKFRLKRLLRWNLALLGLFAVGGLLIPRPPGTDYLEMMFFIALMIGFVFVPAAVLVAISAGLEHVADSLKERPSDET